MPTPSPDSSAIKIKVKESLIRCYESIAIHFHESVDVIDYDILSKWSKIFNPISF